MFGDRDVLRSDMRRYEEVMDQRRKLRDETELRVRDLRKTLRWELEHLRMGRIDIPLFRVEEVVGGTYRYEEYLVSGGVGGIERRNVRNRYLANKDYSNPVYEEKPSERSRMGAEDGKRIPLESYVSSWPLDDPIYMIELGKRIDELNTFFEKCRKDGKKFSEIEFDMDEIPLSTRTYG